VQIGSVFLTSGSIDPFASLENQWHVAMDTDASGRMAIAVSIGLTDLVWGHGEHFGEPLPQDLSYGVLVTILDPSGARSPAQLVDTHKKSELHVVRFVGDALALGGRVLTERRADGYGWDGFVAIASPQSAPSMSLLDVDRGEAVLDLLAAGCGRLFAVGSSGYWQNPAGGSISEEASPLLTELDAQGRLVRRIAVPAGPRHNQLRSVTLYDGALLLGGLQNGPGTHSADGDPALLKADGLLRAVATSF
jgi:hypothetical protein